MSSVTIYTKPNCVDCNKTKNYMKSKGIEFYEVDMTKDPAALDYVKSMGFLRAPVVDANDIWWSGYDEHKIREFCK